MMWNNTFQAAFVVQREEADFATVTNQFPYYWSTVDDKTANIVAVATSAELKSPNFMTFLLKKFQSLTVLIPDVDPGRAKEYQDAFTKANDQAKLSRVCSLLALSSNSQELASTQGPVGVLGCAVSQHQLTGHLAEFQAGDDYRQHVLF